MARIAHLIRFRCEVIALTRLVTVSRDGGGGDEDGEDRHDRVVEGRLALALLLSSLAINGAVAGSKLTLPILAGLWLT